GHWGVENRLHWVMDVVFHDDLMRLRTEHGPANMAAIRHASLNLIKAIPDKASLKVRGKTLAWDDEYLRKTITQAHR
ncbi:MAG: ISAs1 family transposase, partial [Pikeienuella sp.]